ncbi:MAG: sigma-54-dependent transcriptional regulator, partial [Acidobacteriota bacterium]
MQGEVTVLIIDDEQRVRDSLTSLIKDQGYRVLLAEDGASGLALIRREPVDVVLTDLMMPGLSEINLIREMRHQFPELLIICITGYGSVRGAVEAIKEGAYDYLMKPLDPDELLLTLGRASDRQRLLREVRALRSELTDRFHLPGLVGKCGKMREIFRTISKVADSSSTVLIQGESGTGKELIARALHSASTRRDKSFLAVHCSTIPETLMESELFGHEKGSFTGAFRTQIGKFELVKNGTIFLDDIGDVPPSVQVKLLRVLQEREFMRLGGSDVIPVHARVVASTSKDLVEDMRNKTFREDLY